MGTDDRKIDREIRASQYTNEINEKSTEKLDFNDHRDFEDADSGYKCTIDSGIIKKENTTSNQDTIAYNMRKWDFLGESRTNDAPDTVNPSLWRQGKLNRKHGLFEVIKGCIYQIRGFDIANMTFIKGDKGWVVIDVLGTKEPAQAGLKLFKEYLERENQPFGIAAVIITHPHADHYGGIDAFDTLVIVAPENFMKHAVDENITAGRAMHRRARYMYGMLIEQENENKNEKSSEIHAGPVGSVGSGLGQTNSTGKQSLRPTLIEVGKDEKWDAGKIGLEIEFIYVTETEAPVEIMMYFSRYKAFCVAEEMNRNMHNLVTLRGAKVRNGLVWSKAIDRAICKYADITDVSFSTHQWPTWGKENIRKYWESQRDMYRYLHDQTLWHANRGLTPNEIAEAICLPDAIQSEFHNRGYYGTTSHNVKSQYQLYFGWYDGNPANLNPLPPEAAGKKYVEAIGGAEKVIENAQKSYDKGEYRWAAMLLNHLVFAEPENDNARILLANVYTQLGYQSESGPWRNFYLIGAQDLVTYSKDKKHATRYLDQSDIAMLNAEQLFDFMAINVDTNKAAFIGDLKIDLHFTDTNEICTLILQNSALTNRVKTAQCADTAQIKMEFAEFKTYLLKCKSPDMLALTSTPKHLMIDQLFGVLDFETTADFNIVVP